MEEFNLQLKKKTNNTPVNVYHSAANFSDWISHNLGIAFILLITADLTHSCKSQVNMNVLILIF